jgi:hypothetical protein
MCQSFPTLAPRAGEMRPTASDVIGRSLVEPITSTRQVGPADLSISDAEARLSVRLPAPLRGRGAAPQKAAQQGCATLSSQPQFFTEILDFRRAIISTGTNIEDQMKFSRCQWCPITASIECMRACLQQRAADHNHQRLTRRWAWLPPPRPDASDSEEDGHRIYARRVAP